MDVNKLYHPVTVRLNRLGKGAYQVYKGNEQQAGMFSYQEARILALELQMKEQNKFINSLLDAVQSLNSEDKKPFQTRE